MFDINYKNALCLILLSFFIQFWQPASAQIDFQDFTVTRIKYDGGGDWYGNKTTFVNLLKFMSTELNIQTTPKEVTAAIMDENFFNYPMAYISGHGNIKFSEEEGKRLRNYLVSGGFLFADDDYGMDRSFRREMAKVFPELKFVELPFQHPIYKVYFMGLDITEKKLKYQLLEESNLEIDRLKGRLKDYEV